MSLRQALVLKKKIERKDGRGKWGMIIVDDDG